MTIKCDLCDLCGRYATLNEPRGWDAKRNAPAYGPVCHRCYDDVQPRYTEAEHLAAVAKLRAEGLQRLDVYSEEEWPVPVTIQFRAGDDRFPESRSWEDLDIERIGYGYRFTVGTGNEITPAQALRCLECVGNLDDDQCDAVGPAIDWCRSQLAATTA